MNDASRRDRVPRFAKNAELRHAFWAEGKGAFRLGLGFFTHHLEGEEAGSPALPKAGYSTFAGMTAVVVQEK